MSVDARDTNILSSGLNLCSGFWRRSFAITAKYSSAASRVALSQSGDLAHPLGGMTALSKLWVSYLRESMSVPLLLAQDAAVSGLQRGDLQRSYDVQGRPVLLPARVKEAKQGSAVFLVPCAKVCAELKQDGYADAFEPFTLQDGAVTPVTIFFIDYIETDLGAYLELGLAFHVVPKSAPALPPGMFMHRLWVNQPFTLQAGRDIWGFPKQLAALSLAIRGQTARFEMREHAQASPSIVFSTPRSGSHESTDVTLINYTMWPLDKNQVDPEPALSTFVRSGRGESVRPGGSGVSVQLGAEPGASPFARLGLDSLCPVMHTWTEHMSGQFEPLSRVSAS